MRDRLTLVREIFEAFISSGSGDLLFAAVTEDVTCQLTIAEGTPLSGVFHGKAGLQEYFTRQGDVAELEAVEVLSYLQGESQVAVVGRESMRVKRSGQVARNLDWVTLLTFRGDQICSILTLEDTSAIAAAYRA
ncbi:MAG TPA: nuclear transport factor 2 family protein [Pseudomonadota bacterium]|nr:nuclear transport factor 2 family protein [Pseudomonadota bacterium]